MFGYDLKQAATYFFQDDKKIVKIIALYVLTILSMLLSHAKHFSIYYILLIPPVLYFYGYLAKNANSRILKSQLTLPELNDWENYLIIGLKNVAGMAVYGIPFIVLCGIFAIPIFLLKDNLTAMLITMPIACVLAIAIFVIAMIAFMAIQIAFSINLKFKSMFDVKLLKQIIFKNYKPLIGLLLVIVILGICSVVISTILAITIIGIVLLPLIQLYLFLIMSDLYGQFISKSIKSSEG